ncbi:MBL fold metallo-hydrolase [Microbacterium sp.]|uniref:MBL fold metallo-hydrolase n=1 Tax=Microbacterium sp. TaxID=51671 RepID=UPI003A873091
MPESTQDHTSEQAGFSRRALIAGGIGAAGAAGLGVFGSSPAIAASAGSRSRRHRRKKRTHVVLLGTGGGPTYYNAGQRGEPSSAFVVGDRYYLIDAGAGVLRQTAKARLGSQVRPGRDPLDQLRAVFITHQHSDHIGGLAGLVSVGLFNGTIAADRPIKLIGPGNRGALHPLVGDAPPPPVVNPDNPTPGTRDMFRSLVAAYATDFNDRARDNRRPVPDELWEAIDIELPSNLTADPNGNPTPEMDPITIYSDDRVSVSAILVAHGPAFPAFAFRFDTDDGSAVFSGDTSPNPNLITLAADADVLVHEVISRQAYEEIFPEPRTPAQEALLQHILGSHTTIEDVGPIAEAAGVKTLALNHLAPSDLHPRLFARAGRNFSGKTIVGEDLMVVNIGGPTV